MLHVGNVFTYDSPRTLSLSSEKMHWWWERELATCLPSSLLLILLLFPYLLSLLFHRPGIRLIGETELSSWLDPTSIIKFGNLGGEGRG